MRYWRTLLSKRPRACVLRILIRAARQSEVEVELVEVEEVEVELVEVEEVEVVLQASSRCR